VIDQIMVGGDEWACEGEQIQVCKAEGDQDRMGQCSQSLSSFNRTEQNISIRTAIWRLG
jgi:hypothetical protein